MKKSNLSGAVGLLVAIGVGALALWLFSKPLPHHALPPSAHVAVAPLLPEPSTAPQGDESHLTNSVIAPAPEHEVMPPPDHHPEIAIVIDDMGLTISGSQRATRLPAAVTLSYMPYAERLDEQTAAAREAGHELMLHMPMEPMGHEDPGPGALLTSLSPAEIRARFDKALGSFEDFDGVNNHMGSRFTADTAGMEIVIEELQKHGLFFLDSRTSPRSVGFTIAQKRDLPTIARDVFLDDVITPPAVRAQLAATERVAERKGYAVAIGHPHEVTLQVLEAWIPDAEKRGFVFVPVHDLIKGRVIKASSP